MDILELLTAVQSAVSETKAKEVLALEKAATLETVKADAKKAYDAAVSAAEADYQAAHAAYRDAQIAGERLKAQVNDALGGVFTPSDPRVRMSR